MNTKYYFVFMVLILVIIGGGYWYLDQERGDIEDRVFCTPESRLSTVCIDRVNPVCGWFDSSKVRCVAYPCASEYPNECEACRIKSVLYYTPGECPETG